MQAELTKALIKVEEQAQFIAGINQDKASVLVKAAIRKIEEEKDIKSALLILHDEKLEAAYQLALDEKLKVEEKIKQVIEAYEFKISLLLSQFRYKEAAIYYEQIIKIYQNNHFDKLGLAQKYSKISKVYYDDSKYSVALEYQKKGLIILEELLDVNHPQLGSSYNNTAIIYQALGNYPKAIEYGKKATTILETILDADSSSIATSYGNISIIYKSLGNLRKALEYGKKDITISENLLDTKNPSLAISYGNIATIYESLGDYTTAMEYHQKAINIQEAVLDTNHPDLATSYNNIAITYQDLEEYRKALVYHQKAINIQEVVLDTNHPDLAISYSGIAATHRKLGNFQQSLKFNKKALIIQEAVLDAKHLDLAVSYNNIALTYLKLRDYAQAFAYTEKAIVIFKIGLPENHPKQWGMQENMRNIYRARGEQYIAEKEYIKAISDFDKVLIYNIEYKEIDSSRLNQYYIENNFRINEADIKRIFEINQFIIRRNESEVLSLRGLCYYFLKQYDKAIEDYQKAVEANPDLKQKHFYNNIGTAYAKKGEFEKANDAFTQYEKLDNQNSRVYRNWAMFYALKKDKTKAIANLQKAVGLGYKDVEWITTDDSLESIRKNTAYQALVEQLKKQGNK